MDYKSAIEKVYENLENDYVDKAVMICLRIARNMQDYLYSAIFLREMHPNKKECMRIIYDDVNHLKIEKQKYIWERSLECWFYTHTLDFTLSKSDSGEERNVFAIGVSEIDPEIEQWERTIAELVVPQGMGEFDTAAFTDSYYNRKAEFRLRIKALQIVKQKIKNRCLNYAIRVEKQLENQAKSINFLEKAHTEVDNYFIAHSEVVYRKLQKAAQLVDSNSTEDNSLLLTQVRRAIKATADYFYAPSDQEIVCSDGKKRILNDEKYLNRLDEFLNTKFKNSSSHELLKSEFEYLSVFARRLNEVASKGVHADVTSVEAKQGFLGLYMFLFNIINRLQNEK